MTARDLMQHQVVTIHQDLSVAELCDLFQQEHVHGAPVVDEEGHLVGFVSLEDVVYGSMGEVGGADDPLSRKPRGAGKRGRARPPRRTVREIMTAPAVSAAEETEMTDVCRIMWKLRIHHVPVTKERRVTGIISSLDLCRAISEGEIRA